MICKLSHARYAGIVIVLIAAAIPPGASASEDTVGAWMILSSSGPVDTHDAAGNWRYWFDAQARYFDIGSGSNQYLVRPGIGYSLGDNVSVWAGYARFRTRNRAGNVVDENRFWQQLSWTAWRGDAGVVTMRARLQQRSVSNGEDLGLVLRYQVKYAQPLGDSNDTRLIFSIEPFFALRETDWAGGRGLRQNRVFLGGGWEISDRLALEAGYMNQYVWADNAEDRSNHLGVINLRIKL